MGIKKKSGVFFFLDVPVAIGIFKFFLHFFAEGMGYTKVFPCAYGVKHDMGQAVFSHSFGAEVETETGIKCGGFGEEPFQFLHRGCFSVFVGKVDLEVADHPRHLCLAVKLLFLGQCLHHGVSHVLVPKLVIVDTAQIRPRSRGEQLGLQELVGIVFVHGIKEMAYSQVALVVVGVALQVVENQKRIIGFG